MSMKMNAEEDIMKDFPRLTDKALDDLKGQPNIRLCSYSAYIEIIKSLGSQVEYVDVDAGSQFYLRGVRHNGFIVIPDRRIE